MAVVDEGAARKQPAAPGFAETQERVFGWMCKFCRQRTKEDKCPKCGKIKEEARE